MWVHTYSGRAVDLLNPQPEQIDTGDIARSLARQARYNGHTLGATDHVLSVAQHSVLVYRITLRNCPGDTAAHLWALLHDAHEAYMGDVATPVRQALRWIGGEDVERAFRTMQSELDFAIAAKYRLSAADLRRVAPAVHRADRIALATEVAQFMSAPPRSWGQMAEPSDILLEVQPPRVAAGAWLACLEQATRAHYEAFLPKPYRETA